MYAASAPLAAAVRSYGAHSTVDRHDFAQLVLPLAGTLAMDIGGRERVLDRGVAAFVEPGARHDQTSRAHNRAIIVDLRAGVLDASTCERLTAPTFHAVPADAVGLVDWLGTQIAHAPVTSRRLQLWLPLLLDALLGDGAQPRSRLVRLLDAIEADLARGWTVETMAARVGVGASRLHALFQAELGQTPRGWLAARRLDRARDLLDHTALPIADIALRCGYADQNALTRAMRLAMDATPAAWRRRTRVPA